MEPERQRTYAVVWSSDGAQRAGRLEPFADRLELHGRERTVAVPYAELTEATIDRRPSGRVRGLPVLALAWRGRPTLRIACLEGAGFLHELAARVEAGLLSVGYPGSGA